MTDWTDVLSNTTSWGSVSDSAVDWTDQTADSATWNEYFPDPQFGLPYDSDVLYDSIYTYDAADIAYVNVWIDGADGSTAWTQIA